MDVYNQLKKDILSGAIPFGERIRENQLASRYNVSRTPVREAIRKLAAEDLIEFHPNRGATVRTYTKEDIRDNYNLRAVIEGYACSLAAMNRDEESLALIRQSIVQSEEAIKIYRTNKTESTYQLVEANQLFHSTITRMANNAELPKVLKALTTLPIMFLGFYWFDYEGVIESVNHHKHIEKAIRRGDPDQARAYMEVHILNGRDNVLAHFHEILEQQNRQREKARQGH